MPILLGLKSDKCTVVVLHMAANGVHLVLSPILTQETTVSKENVSGDLDEPFTFVLFLLMICKILVTAPSWCYVNNTLTISLEKIKKETTVWNSFLKHSVKPNLETVSFAFDIHFDKTVLPVVISALCLLFLLHPNLSIFFFLIKDAIGYSDSLFLTHVCIDVVQVFNAIKSQPWIHDDLSSVISHFLSIVQTMYQRCTSSLEVFFL